MQPPTQAAEELLIITGSMGSRRIVTCDAAAGNSYGTLFGLPVVLPEKVGCNGSESARITFFLEIGPLPGLSHENASVSDGKEYIFGIPPLRAREP